MKTAYDLLWRRGLGRLLSLILLVPIRLYQRLVSPLTGPTCRYHPSCSAYGAVALQTHGPFKGVTLGAWRVLRCNPWSRGGIDPVPSRGRWRPDVLPDGSPRTAVIDQDADTAAHAHTELTASPGTPAPTSLPGV